MKKKLIIINSQQFGYHIDTYYYCKYLKKFFDITYICWDHGFQKIDMENIKSVYISRKANLVARSIRFIRSILKETNYSSKDKLIILIKYFQIVSFLMRILKPSHLFILDIRTGKIAPQKIKRIFCNILLKFEAIFFKNITVISESLAKKLKLNHKAHILPLGSNIIPKSIKTFEELNLLYVGTLYIRCIDDTINGFKKFYDEFNCKIKMSYTIIGSGDNREEETLKELVDKHHLSDIINIIGQIPHDQLEHYFDSHNIGVSYIPVTDYFDVQPSTKTFEYLLSGMPVIATATSENKKIVSSELGVLIMDSERGFYDGLKDIYKNKDSYNSQKIINSQKEYIWENIILNNLKPYLDNIMR